MDPAQYYPQGSSSHLNQQQNHGGNNQQLVRADPNAVNEYIRSLYNNPSQYQLSTPTNDPTFYQLARQVVLDRKHKMEQMLLTIQQQSELATMMSTAGTSTGVYTQIPAASGSMHTQAYQQPPPHPLVNNNGAWGNTTSQWSYAPQGYIMNQEQHTHSAHISPEVETRNLYPDQRYVQMAQTGATGAATVSNPPRQIAVQPQQSVVQPQQLAVYPQQQYQQPVQPQQHVQPQQQHIQPQQQHVQVQRPLTQPRPQIQYQPQPQQQVQRAYSSQPSQPQQAASVPQQRHATQAPAAQTTQLYQPQPQPHPKRHPLQPDEQHPQAESSQVSQTKKEQQAATTQKQLQYLALLQQQHQRAQGRPSPTSQQSSLPQTTVPTLPTQVPGNGASVSQTVSSQLVLSDPPQSDRAVLPTQLTISRPGSLPPNETNAPLGNLGQPPETPSKSQSPSKLLRSTPAFSLMDLRAPRRRSDRVTLVEQDRRSNATDKSARGPNQGTSGSIQTEVSDRVAQPIREGSDVGATSRAPVSNDNPQPASRVRDSFSEPLKPDDPIMSSDISSTNTSSAAGTRPPSLPATALAGSAPAALAQAAAPLKVSSAPTSTPVASGSVPDASVPALNSGPSMNTPGNMAAHASGGSQPVSAAEPVEPGTLKAKLDYLHSYGIDCVAIVKRAAELVGAPTELLQGPSARVGPAGESVSLFSIGQPVQVWMENLRVPQTQGDEIAKHIWSIMHETERIHGISMAGAQLGRQSGANLAAVPGSHVGSGAPPPAARPVLVGNAAPATQPLPIPVPQSTVSRHQPTFNVPSVRSQGSHTLTGSYNTALAQHQHFNSQTAASRSQGTPAHHSYQSHPIYQRAGMQAQPKPQTPPIQQRPQVAQLPSSQPSTSAPKPAKMGGGTPALDFLRAIGVDLADGSSSATENDPRSDAGRGAKEKKVRPKDKAVKEVAITPVITVATQPPVAESPVREPIAPEPPVAQPKVQLDQGEASPSGTTQTISENAAPVEVVESHAVSVETSEPPPPPEPPIVPSSPLLAPTIAVLQEPRSPTTTASPPPDSVADPSSALDYEDVTQPLESGPAVTATMTPAPAPASVPVQTPTPAPSPGPAQYLVLPPAPSPSAPAPDVQMADPAPSGSTQAPSAPAPRPASSDSQRPPVSAEYAPLKRKRESMPAPPPEPSGEPGQSWAEVYAKAANQLANKMTEHNNRAKKARSEVPQPARSPEPVKDKGKGKATPLFKPETPPRNYNKGKGKMLLFQPETPPNDHVDDNIDAIIDVVGDDAPRTVSTTRRPSGSKGKRRMIMEVVLPLRKKKAKSAAKPQAPVQAMIDLTMDDESESEGEATGGLDEEDEEEEEEDMKMLRRRLREHRCKWRGCVGPAVLSSAELLGVHLNKKHAPRRDMSGHYTCRWGDCGMEYQRGKDLWEHISEEHIIKPLWCPYQNCARAAVDKYQLDIHIRRKHRGRVDQELRPLARPEECAPSGQILRPEAFPANVPYFRIMGMVFRYNVLPASVSTQWHTKNGPKILRKISGSLSPVQTVAPLVLSQTPRPSTSEAGGNLPAFGSPPMVARPYVRLSTVPPDVLEDEIEAVGGHGRGQVSPTRSHITVHSDDETPPPTPTRARGRPRGRPPLATRGRVAARGTRGRGRGRGGSIAAAETTRLPRMSAPRASAPTSTSAPAGVPQTPATSWMGAGSVSTPPTASSSSRAAPGSSKPRLRMFVELPSQGRKERE